MTHAVGRAVGVEKIVKYRPPLKGTFRGSGGLSIFQGHCFMFLITFTYRAYTLRVRIHAQPSRLEAGAD